MTTLLSTFGGKRYESEDQGSLEASFAQRVSPFGRNAFRICGAAGLVTATMLSMVLANLKGLSPVLMATVALFALFTILGWSMFFKILTGKERYVFYHNAIVVVAFVLLITVWSNLPVLSYLDLTAIGVGQFLWVGRIGCLLAGCCYGRPSRLGVCYDNHHADEGFPRSLVGVRLLPTQLVESVVVLGIVVVAVFSFINNDVPGSIFSFIVISYAIERTVIEFTRGDGQRYFFAGLSEAQWTSALIMSLVVYAELTGVLPLQLWDVAATLTSLCLLIAIAIWRRNQSVVTSLIAHPDYLIELATAIQSLNRKLLVPKSNGAAASATAISPKVDTTSIGLKISLGRIQTPNEMTLHYALSQSEGQLTARIAQRLSLLIARLHRSTDPVQLIPGANGVFHLLLVDKEGPRS